MALPFLNDSNEKVQASAQAIVNDLNYAKQQAMLNRTPVKVTFNLSSPSYSITDSGGTPIQNPLTKRDYNITLNNINMAVDIDDSSDTVTFNSLGNLDTGGTIVLSGSNAVTYTVYLSITGTINISSN